MTNRPNDDLAKKDYSFTIAAIVTLIIILGLWFGTYFLLRGEDPLIRGTFGDMFGSINALFSGLALAGIILTILLQRKELSLQREELKYTREELKRSADAQEKSEIALNRQAENLKISAKLTALNTLVNYYTDLEEAYMERAPGHPQSQVATARKNGYLLRIEEILADKENPAGQDLQS